MNALPLLLALVPLLCAAAGDERAAIVAERSQLAERYAAEERTCADRFAVNACVDDVRARRRAALQPLRERELRLDQAERQQRAEERRAAIAAKRQAAAARPAAAASAQLRVREPAPQRPAAAPRPARSRDEAARAAEAAARARESEQRREEAQAAQQRVQQRQLERELSGKRSEPLPLPAPAGSAPRR